MDDILRIKCRAMLTKDEGQRRYLYEDSYNNATIGIGHNLDSNPISQRAIDVIFEDDLEQAIQACKRILGSTFDELSENRKAGIINLAFNLGEKKLSEFVGMLKAVKIGDWGKASACLRESLWFKQVGIRAERVIAMLCWDEFPYVD